MTIFGVLVGVTLRALLGRRRTILLVLLAGVPVLVGLLVRANGGSGGNGEADGSSPNVGAALDALVIRVVLPLVALVFGTGAIGSELEDGTAVYVLTKPIRRSTIVVAKMLVAGTLTAALLVPSTLIAGILIAPPGVDPTLTTIPIAIGVLAGSYVYVAIFVALSIVTSRGLLIGLGYALIWEGILAGLLPGSQVFSVGEYVRGIAHLVSAASLGSAVGDAAPLYAAVVLVAAVVFGSIRLAAYEVRGSD
jgi:ABC-2 type transport system permease protein